MRLTFVLLLATLPAASTGHEALLPALNSIVAEDVLRHERYLASPELEGRDTPKHGLELAAEYIAKELKSYGLQPGGKDGSYFQPFDLEVTVPDDACALTVGKSDSTAEDHACKLNDDFVPIWGSAESEVNADVVFAGYGITATDERYDDYAGKKVSGKVVLVLTHEPREGKKGQAFKGPEVTEFSSLLSKAKNAYEHGAVGLLAVTDPKNHESKGPIDYQFPSMESPHPRPEQQVPIPMMSVSLAIAEKILGQPIAPLQEKLDSSMKGRLVQSKDRDVTMKVAFRKETAHPRNVVAVYPGSDPAHEDEAVVLGAHYDHVGVNDKGQIYFGADDNASGTSGLLEVAQALATTKPTSRRQIDIVWFAGEEKGLLGSAAYVKDPVVSIAKTVAMLNVDMIGRMEPNEVCAISRTKSRELYEHAERLAANPAINFKLKSMGEEFFKRSDQYNFYKGGVPVLFFFGGKEHEDYHKPTDTVDKIDTKKVARTARLLLLLALDVANDNTPPERPKPE
ncbi:MAG: M28 family peptidase [Planctomycetes bacterium]|nr:M28 family peptidase [Planctomycetota bacterium]